MKTKCYKGGNKHKFEARYEEKEINATNLKIPLFHSTPEDARKLYIKKVYVKDICTWCGKDIKK